ncbi:MAG: TlpA family protein disulfide reductase [Deltaproteobacteria bacterium]|nr:TlpA family protein disulfide reductase [Deltaproteobacteria bacterium]
MYKRMTVGVVVALLCMTMIVGCSQDESPPPSGKNLVVPIDVNGIEALIKTQDCPVMLVAMASWCAPCRAELPILQKMYEKYKDEGLRIIGISLDVGGPSAMQPLVDQMGLGFPVYWGGEKVTAKYSISAIPLTYVVKKGKIVEKILGQRSENFIEGKIVSLLGKCKE